MLLQHRTAGFDVVITLARWHFLIIVKLFSVTLKITFEKFMIVDLQRIYSRLRAKFGLAGLRGLRTYLGIGTHTYTQTHTDKSSIMHKIGLYLYLYLIKLLFYRGPNVNQAECCM